MTRSFTFAMLLALAGCSALPPAQYSASPCASGEANYACQVQRYQDVAQ